MKKRFAIILILLIQILPLAADDIADRITKIKWASCFIQDPVEFDYHTELEFPVLNTPQEEETDYYRFVLRHEEISSLIHGDYKLYEQVVSLFTKSDKIFGVPNVGKKPYSSDTTLRETNIRLVDRYIDIPDIQADYWIRLTDSGYWMTEEGVYPVKYDPKTRTFTSIPVLGQTEEHTNYGTKVVTNDEFSFQVINDTEMEELLLFQDFHHQRVYFPIEQLLYPGSAHTIKNSKVKIYKEPSFAAEFVWDTDTSKDGGVKKWKVLERTNTWVERDGRLSVWVKTQLDDGTFGWIWGSDLEIYTSKVLPKDSGLYQRIRKLEIILSPEYIESSKEHPFSFTEIHTPGTINRQVELRSSTLYNDPPFRTLHPGEHVSVLKTLGYTYSSYAFVECSDGQQGWITLDSVTYPTDGTTSPGAATKTTARILKAADNLRLRKSELTSSDIVTTMLKGTPVKIVATGRQETIDGITGNWVQVEVQSGGKDRNGSPIPAGTTGWCFGGYLE